MRVHILAENLLYIRDVLSSFSFFFFFLLSGYTYPLNLSWSNAVKPPKVLNLFLDYVHVVCLPQMLRRTKKAKGTNCVFLKNPFDLLILITFPIFHLLIEVQMLKGRNRRKNTKSLPYWCGSVLLILRMLPKRIPYEGKCSLHICMH